MEQVSLPAALDMAPNGAEGVKAKIKIATPNPVSRRTQLSQLACLPVGSTSCLHTCTPRCDWCAVPVVQKGVDVEAVKKIVPYNSVEVKVRMSPNAPAHACTSRQVCMPWHLHTSLCSSLSCVRIAMLDCCRWWVAVCAGTQASLFLSWVRLHQRAYHTMD